MAQTSRPWSTTGTGDGALTGYTADQWATSWRQMLRAHTADRGVIISCGNSLSVSNPAGSTIRVPTGAAIVHGVWYENDAQADYTPGDGTYPALPTDNRIHRVVLRKNWTAQTVRIAFISGTDAVAPTTPSLTQLDGATWEIPLAQFQISSAGAISGFTDQRVNVGETKAFIGDVTNANMTAGLTINQAGSDDEILALKSSDVAHGMTALAETDTFFDIIKSTAAGGGARIAVLEDSGGGTSGALWLMVVQGQAPLTTKTTDAYGVVRVTVGIPNGVTGQACAADSNLFSIDNWGTTRFILDAEGTIHLIIGDADIDIIRLSGTTGAPAFAWNETRDRFTLSKGLELTAGMLFLNDTANANMTTGITVNQGAAQDVILGFKSSTVAHTITDIIETDTYGWFMKQHGTEGGLKISGVVATGQNHGAIWIEGQTVNAADTGKLGSDWGIINLNARVKDGANNVQAVGADGNLVTISNHSVVRFIFDAEGSAHADVEWVAFDAYDDVALLNKLDAAMTRDPIKTEFGRFLSDYREQLQAAKIAHFYDDSRPRAMLNTTRLSMLLVGAVRQLSNRLQVAEQRLSALPSPN